MVVEVEDDGRESVRFGFLDDLRVIASEGSEPGGAEVDAEEAGLGGDGCGGLERRGSVNCRDDVSIVCRVVLVCISQHTGVRSGVVFGSKM